MARDCEQQNTELSSWKRKSESISRSELQSLEKKIEKVSNVSEDRNRELSSWKRKTESEVRESVSREFKSLMGAYDEKLEFVDSVADLLSTVKNTLESSKRRMAELQLLEKRFERVASVCEDRSGELSSWKRKTESDMVSMGRQFNSVVGDLQRAVRSCQQELGNVKQDISALQASPPSIQAVSATALVINANPCLPPLGPPAPPMTFGSAACLYRGNGW